MVTKTKTDKKEQKKSRVKVSQLKLNKETVRDLTASEAKKIRGASLKCNGAFSIGQQAACAS